ncbi:TPA: glycosyltransferase [Streptococcus suis]|nr:glycosyltransferase [Streptococcus suis]
MQFSVLMSVYKNEKPEFLIQSLKSVMEEQTVLPSEVILVQDGPLTEQLYEAIDSLSATFENLKVVNLPENVGLGAALSYGMKFCSYEWIARMDSDDIADPTRFEKQINYLISNPQISVLGGAISEFGENIDDIRAIKYLPEKNEDIRKMLKRRSPMSHVTVMFNKNAVIAAGGYQTMLYIEDYYLWARMIAMDFQMANLKDILVHVRVGNGMYARRGNREYINSWKHLNIFMLNRSLISHTDLIINMILIKVFVFMPKSLKELLYRKVLRRKK